MQTTGPVSHGAKTGINATAQQLTPTPAPLVSGLYLQALATNTATVYVGISGVTVANGYPLAPGVASLLIPVQDASSLFVISTGGSQEVRWIGG